MMLKQLFVAGLISTVLALTACETVPTQIQQEKSLALMQNKIWILTHIGAVEYKTDPSAHNVPSIQFDAATSRFTGADGCNRLLGSYTVKGYQLDLGQIASTKMMCENTTELAEKYNHALSQVAGYQSYNKTLKLLDRNGNVVLRYALK